MQPNLAKIGILVGSGALPERLIAAVKKAERPYFLIAFKDQTPKELVEDEPHKWVRLGAAGRAIKHLRDAGCEEIVMAGRIKRPSFTMLMPDAWTASFFARHGMAALGDDGLLKALVHELEEREGFKIVAIDDLMPDIVMPDGLLTETGPDDDQDRDIQRGFHVAKAIGALDVGQGCVVQQGLVLAVEAIEGTAEMIARAGKQRRDGPGPVLVKVKKPDQEERADLPTIGPDTIKQAKKAGLSGIAVEAGGAILIDRAATVKAADKAGLFLIGINAEDFDV